MDDSWFKSFFRGLALDVWKTAMSPEITLDEAAFLANQIGAPVGASLLDIPCGNGRLSFALQEMGFQVTGVDACEEFIEEANARKTASGSTTEFKLADMRQVLWNNEFDGAFCMGNSFGFFNHSQCRELIKSVATALKPGGRFVLDTLMVAESFLVGGGQKEWQQIDDTYMLVENTYDCKSSVVRSEYTFLKGEKKQIETAYYWIFTSGEICRMCEDNGLSIVDLFGSTDCDEFEPGAPRLLLVAEKQ